MQQHKGMILAYLRRIVDSKRKKLTIKKKKRLDQKRYLEHGSSTEIMRMA